MQRRWAKAPQITDRHLEDQGFQSVLIVALIKGGTQKPNAHKKMEARENGSTTRDRWLDPQSDKGALLERALIRLLSPPSV